MAMETERDQYIARGDYDELLKDISRVLKTSSKNDPVPSSGDSDEGNEVPLTKKDITNIADIEYDWGVGDSSAVIFKVVDTNELLSDCTSQLLDEVKQNNKPLVYIVDLGSSYWVTLVIVYRDQQFFAYYIDPLGKKVDNNLKEHLEKESIHCPNIEFKQTDFNTGIFALKNLEVIFERKRSTQNVILKQRQSFSEGINGALEKMQPPNDGQGLKDEISKNDKYKRVDYDDLENRLDSLCSTPKKDKTGETTFIIPSGNTPKIILTVGFRDEQVVACYVANDSNDNNDNINKIKNLLSKKRIILIFGVNMLSKFANDIELFFLQSAKVVTNYFNKNHDYITLAMDELKKVVLEEKEIEGVINRLKARNKIEEKIVRCESVIDKYKQQYGTRLNSKDFTEAQSNILILFLESIALEDVERSLGEKLKRIRTRIMGQDFKVFDIIRSKNLVHRSDSNINTIIKCSDINKFIRHGVNRVEFFGKLQTYLNQIIDKLNNTKKIDSTPEIKVGSFFKTESEIEKISYEVKTEEKIKEYLSNSFREFVNTNSYSSKDIQMIMFNLVVNVIPLLEGLYSDKKKNKNKKLEIEELRKIQKEKNELLHNFHKYENENIRKFELKKFIDKMKPTFFKYVYSQSIYELLKKSIPLSIEENLKNSLNLKDFNYVADEFGDQNKAVTFQSIASKLEPSSSENSLRNFISNYVKIMYLIDNEDEIQKRKKKHPSLPQRYDQLTDNYDRLSDMRLYVYEHFNLLKQLCPKNSSDESYEYKLIKVQVAKELKNNCGILKPSFESIVDLYVKGLNNMEEIRNGLDQFIERIYDDIATVSKIQEKDKDLKISDIIESYDKRESLQAKERSHEEKFKSIPKGEIVNINGVDVSTDRFVVNILKLFDSIASQYKNVFKNVEEAFNDETFLSFLTHNNINFSRQVWNELLSLNYLSLYIIELIVRDQLNDPDLVNFDAFNGIIEKLLESNLCVVHLKKLLEISDDKLLTILGQNNVSLNRDNVKSELYKQVCERIRIDNVSNLYQLLEDEVHAIEILNKLSEIIIPGNANNLDKQRIKLIKSILDLLDRVSEELIYKKDYDNLDKILNSAGVKNLVSTLLQIDNSDLNALKIRRRRAVIENKKDKKYDTAKGTLKNIRNRIQLNAQVDTQSFFLLVSSDIAYTNHLKKEYNQAYKEYEALYKKMIELSLTRTIDDWNEFSLVGTYNEIMNSQKYVSILKYSPKYLDILKIRSDMAYELTSFALSKEKESQDEALKSYEDALKIYEEVFKIKATTSVLGQDIVKNMRDIAYVNNKLAKLKLSSSKLSEALNHFEIAFTKYGMVLRIQEREQWETHPANSKTIKDIIQAMHNVAFVNSILGSSKSSNNPEETLEHYKKALEIYRQIYEFQKVSLGEEHNYTLKTKKSVSCTHNQLAHLYDNVGNIDEAISHCEANLKLLEVNSEEYKKAKSFLDKLTLDNMQRRT